jgi:hypothetical protein
MTNSQQYPKFLFVGLALVTIALVLSLAAVLSEPGNMRGIISGVGVVIGIASVAVLAVGFSRHVGRFGGVVERGK